MKKVVSGDSLFEIDKAVSNYATKLQKQTGKRGRKMLDFLLTQVTLLDM